MPGEVFTKAPFGKRINVKEDDGPGLDEDDSGFTGKDFDGDIGLYYYNARFYDPEIGRFITEDSVIDPNNQGNAYVYVANNPVNNIDPTGHSLSSLFGTLGKINQALNLAAEFDPNLKGLASAFDSFTGALSNVRDFVMGAQQVFGQKNIKVTKDKVIVKTKDGGEKIYDKKDMKTDFQKLAKLQESKTDPDKKFETEVKNNYKDYFEAVKGDNTGVTLIGLRGWGKGTPVEDTNTLKGEHPYDDMLLVLDEKGNLGAFSEVNFEGSTAKGHYYKQDGTKVDLDGENPSILDDNYTLNTVIHSGYDALTLNNDKKVPTGPGQNPNYPDRKPPYAEGIHIHKGGTGGWNYSKGCITLRDANGQWERFMSYFPTGLATGTRVGTFSLMTL